MTKIEWVKNADGSQGLTWNPIVGCTIASPGCTNCYAMRMAARLEAMGQPRYVGLTKPSKAGAVWTGEMKLAEEALTIPLRRKKPTTWFVNSMSDLFHESVPDEWIDRVLAVMAHAQSHTFQVLTKRSARMRAYFARPANEMRDRIIRAAAYLNWFTDGPGDGAYLGHHWPGWPLPNVWLGVSAEDQRRADERVPNLLATHAVVRFVSAEPLLGPISFFDLLSEPGRRIDALRPGLAWLQTDEGWLGGTDSHPALDWIIVGGESGPNARPMHPAWARSIRDQCAAAGIAFHFKQWGAWVGGEHEYVRGNYPGERMCDATTVQTLTTCRIEDIHRFDDRYFAVRVGKKLAGRLLDGVEHNGMPEVRG